MKFPHISTGEVILIFVGALALFFLVCLMHVLFQILNWKYLLKQKWVTYELVPPKHNTKSAVSTEELFSVLHGLNSTRSKKDKLLGHKAVLSLEITSTRNEGIRFICQMPVDVGTIFKQTIASFLPEAEVNEISTAPIFTTKFKRTLQFKQTGHFVHPLRKQDLLGHSDPVAYIAGSMSKLEPEERITYQVILSPIASRIAQKELRNINHSSGNLTGRGIAARLYRLIVGVIDWALSFGEVGLSGPTHSSPKAKSEDRPEKRNPNATNQALVDSAVIKLKEPLFRVNIRAQVASDNPQAVKERLRALKTAMAAYKTPEQSLKPGYDWSFVRQLRGFVFERRLQGMFKGGSCVLSSSEVASIYHFPYTITAKPENLQSSLSRTLPAPASIKNSDNFDVVIGENVHHGTVTPIGLTSKQRQKHMFVVGGTGHGKTTLFEYSIVQDIKNGKGVGIIDPHGDMAARILQFIPKERIKDVIYFNPNDIDFPIGLNMLELNPATSESEHYRLKDRATEIIVETLRKAFSEDGTGGHHIENILRNSLHTAMTVEGATIFTILKLLRNNKYRQSVVKTLEDDNLRDFWNEEFGQAGEFQRVKMSRGVTDKIDRFQKSEQVNRVLGQSKSTINFDEILDGKIFICNLAKGYLGSDTSKLFGSIILSQIQLAAERRVSKDPSKRIPFYLYVDEFQNFATLSFAEMLAESRKYGLFLAMAEQSTSQQDDSKMIETIFANIGILVCFQTGNPADEKLLLPSFRSVIGPGEIIFLPSYSFYIRIPGAVLPIEPFSGRTIVLPSEGNLEVAAQVKEASRANYAIPYVKPKTPPKDSEKPDKPKNRRPVTRWKKKP